MANRKNIANAELAAEIQDLREREYVDREGNVHHRSEKYIAVDESEEK